MNERSNGLSGLIHPTKLEPQRDVGAYFHTPVQQRGSTLLVALIMLVLLTLIALSAINSTTSSIQVVGNAQFREEAKAAAQKAIEKVISDGKFKNKNTPPTSQSIDVNGDTYPDYTVTFAPAPSCLSATAVNPNQPGIPGVCAGNVGALCFWTLWDVTAVVSDIKTGASVVLHQGVRTIAGLNDVAAAGC